MVLAGCLYTYEARNIMTVVHYYYIAKWPGKESEI